MSWVWDTCDDCAAHGAELCPACSALVRAVAGDDPEPSPSRAGR